MPNIETSSSTSNPSKYLLYILSIIGVIVLLFFIFTKVKKGVSNENGVDMFWGTNIKSQGDLDYYILERSKEYCERWKKACSYKNESRRWREQVSVDMQIQQFYLTTISEIIQNNDLPNSYREPTEELFKKKMEECGWSYDRGKWHGQ